MGPCTSTSVPTAPLPLRGGDGDDNIERDSHLVHTLDGCICIHLHPSARSICKIHLQDPSIRVCVYSYSDQREQVVSTNILTRDRVARVAPHHSAGPTSGAAASMAVHASICIQHTRQRSSATAWSRRRTRECRPSTGPMDTARASPEDYGVPVQRLRPQAGVCISRRRAADRG